MNVTYKEKREHVIGDIISLSLLAKELYIILIVKKLLKNLFVQALLATSGRR